jgi:signal transduction histidine kinase
MKSLRSQLTLFWSLLFAMCAALAVVMFTMYRNSAGAHISTARAVTEQTCQAIASRYSRAVPAGAPGAGAPAGPDVELLRALLNLVLVSAPQVEGGVWQAGVGHLAYAYPTYEGSGVKRDVPAAEQPLIVDMASRAAQSHWLQTDVLRGSREALIVTACPMRAARPDLAAWTMTRAGSGMLDAQGNLRAGLAVLVALVLTSGLWFVFILQRGLRHVGALESQLASAQSDADTMPELSRTGVRELDRIVDGFNRYRVRFEEAHARLRLAAQQRSRDQRLAALGRMSGGIAHEIRNPIATMRLKAENALAAAPERQAAALQSIVVQIDRLDGLVRSLLALVQPIELAPVSVALRPWLEERAVTVADRAVAAGVELAVCHAGPETATFDPMHLGRAIDNLLDNAVRHAPRGGHVLLAAQLVDARRNVRHLALSVDDDGPGVPPGLQAGLFEPFHTGRADGTGLGLALAREVALAHGGDLCYQALEPGARFTLELPWHIS